VALGARYLQIAGAAVILARVSVPVSAGVLAVVIPSFALCRRWAGLRIEAHRNTHGVGRGSRDTADIASAPAYAKRSPAVLAGGMAPRPIRRQGNQIAGPRRVVNRIAVRRTVTLLVAVALAVAMRRTGHLWRRPATPTVTSSRPPYRRAVQRPGPCLMGDPGESR